MNQFFKTFFSLCCRGESCETASNYSIHKDADNKRGFWKKLLSIMNDNTEHFENATKTLLQICN